MEPTTESSFYLKPNVAAHTENSSCLYSFSNTVGRPEHNITDYIEYTIARNVTLVYIPILASLGIVGNTLSLFVLLFSSFRRSTTSWYLATIAVLDTLILIYSILDLLYRNLPGCPVYSDVTCPLIQFLFYFSVHFDVLVLVAMTIERYIAVRFPLRSVTLITRKRTLGIITGIGVFSFGLNVFNLFTRFMTTEKETGKCLCWTYGRTNLFFITKIYPWIDSTIYYIIPATSLFIFNILILVNVRRAAKQRETMETALRKGQGQQTQITSMLILVSFAFLILVSPIGIALMVQRTGLAWTFTTPRGRARAALLRMFTDNMMFTNHGVNFAFYCVSGRRFREELKNVVCHLCLKRRRRPSVSVFDTTNAVGVSSSTTSISRVDYDTCV